MASPYTGERFDVVSDWPLKGGRHNSVPLKRHEAERLAERVWFDARAWKIDRPNVRIIPSAEWERWKVLAAEAAKAEGDR